MKFNLSFFVGLLIIVIALSLIAFGIFKSVKGRKTVQSQESSPAASPISGFPQASPLSQTSPPSLLPVAGRDGDLKIYIESPQPLDLLTSPAKISGFVAQTDKNILIKVKDVAGNLLGQQQLNACHNSDACSFEAKLDYLTPTSQTGSVDFIESTDSQTQKPLERILVRFR